MLVLRWNWERRIERTGRGVGRHCNGGATPTPAPGSRFDACEVAERELRARVLPFVVVRRMPGGRVEHIRLDTRGLSVEGCGGETPGACEWGGVIDTEGRWWK